MSQETSRPNSQFTISGLMVDIALMAVLFAGLSQWGTPVGACMASSSAVCLAFKFLFWVALGPLDPFLALVRVKLGVELDPFGLGMRNAGIRALRTAGMEKYGEGKFDDLEGIAREILRKRPGNPDGANLLSLALLNNGKPEQARETLLGLLECRIIAPKSRHVFWNNLAWACFLTGNRDLATEADSYSDMALHSAPTTPNYKGTRGAVLVWNGRIKEGLALLRAAFEENPLHLNRAFNACSIAIGEANCGNLDEADRVLAQARQLHASCPLLGRAEAAIKIAKESCSNACDT